MVYGIGKRLLRAAATFVGCLLFSTAASAATVWIVKGGAASTSNAPGAPLVVSPGAASVDLYMNTLGDTSFGWQLELDVSGTGEITDITGPSLDLGTRLPNGGWQQLGGDIFGQAGKFLAMSFVFLGEAGASIDFSGTFTNSSFNDEVIAQSTILRVVPLPGAAWLLGSAFFALAAAVRRSREAPCLSHVA